MTILQATDFDSAKARVTKIKYKQKDNRYTNFFRNFNFFYNKISELSDSQLNSIAKAVTDNCEVIEIKSWQVEQAITMFNSLNNALPMAETRIKLRIRGRRIYRQNIATNANNAAFRGLMSLSSFCRIFLKEYFRLIQSEI